MRQAPAQPASTPVRKKRVRTRPPKRPSAAYGQLWRIVEGAVHAAFDAHPDYLTDKGQRAARLSIIKRVTGAVLGYAEQSAQGRSRASLAAETGRRSTK